MSLDTTSAPSKRRKSIKSRSRSVSPRRERERLRELERKAALETSPRFAGVIRVIPWLEWCALRGLSLSTAERLMRAGKVKVTFLSERRKGVRTDHDAEFLDSCLRGGK
jgi:hypothetical protein